MAVTAALGFVAMGASALAAPAFAETPSLSAAATATLASSSTPTMGERQPLTMRQIAADAETALDEARDAKHEADRVEADIAASGLDVGTPETSVDTTQLVEQIERLEPYDITPAMFLPTITDDTVEATAEVRAASADLRERLDEAEAKRAAEEEAARKAAEEEAARQAAEAEEQARAEAQASSQSSSQGSGYTASAPAVVSVDPGSAQAIAQQMAANNFGWGDGEFSCLVSLWNRESGWNAQAMNPSSGAYGIPQALPGDKMASHGADWQTNAATQIAWGLDYIAGRYGTPCGAWGHSQSVGWY